MWNVLANVLFFFFFFLNSFVCVCVREKLMLTISCNFVGNFRIVRESGFIGS
jgi:hypothetical protein